jgi:hypothetical protein
MVAEFRHEEDRRTEVKNTGSRVAVTRRYTIQNGTCKLFQQHVLQTRCSSR